MSNPDLARLAYQQLVAAVELLGVALALDAPSEDCPHARTEVAPGATMGNYQRRCLDCGKVLDLDSAHG